MAITTTQLTRVLLPHEPGAWVDIRKPSIGLLAQVQQTQVAGASDVAVMVVMLQGCVVAWSYDDPVTPDNVAALDVETARVLSEALQPPPETGEAQKKGSSRSTRR